MLRIEQAEPVEVVEQAEGPIPATFIVRYRDFCHQRFRGTSPVTLRFRRGEDVVGFLVGLDLDGRLEALPDRMYGVVRRTGAPPLDLDHLHTALRFLFGGTFRVNLAPMETALLTVSKNHQLERFRSHEASTVTAASHDDLWDAMPKDARNAVRRAEREGVKVTHARDGGSFMRYLGLHVARSSRIGAVPLARKDVDLLRESFGDGARLALATFAGAPVAAALTLVEGGAAFVVDQAVLPGHWTKDAHLLVLWEAVKDAIALGARRIDLGPHPLDDMATRRFKEQLGARMALVHAVTSG